jgi:hypothetical protein
MKDKSSYPADEELAALSAPERLELSRDSHRISAHYDFQRAAIDALGAGSFGVMATAAAFSAVPYGAVMSALMAIPAAVYVWKGIQDVGDGVQHAAQTASTDTALRVLFEHQADPPATRVQEAEPAGRVSPAASMTSGVNM